MICNNCGYKPDYSNIGNACPRCHTNWPEELPQRDCLPKMLSGSGVYDSPVDGFLWPASLPDVYCFTYRMYYANCIASSKIPLTPEAFVKQRQQEEKDERDAHNRSEMVDGLKVSTIPPFHLIPRIAYERLAKRVALGEQTKGKDAWNAFSDNQEVLLSRKALARRLGHAIDHATKMLADLAAGKQVCLQDDDAAALCWAGMYAICASDAQQKEEECQPTNSPSVSNNSEVSLLSTLRNLSATPATELPRADQHKVLLQFKTEKDKQSFFTAWHKLQSPQDKSTNTNNSSPATE